MGRLKEELLNRIELFSDRVVDVADALAESGRSRRVVDQMIGCGTSVGANAFEADEALSRADFCRCLGISLKELSETRFWLRLVGRRGWVPSSRLGALQKEGGEIKKILGSIVTLSKKRAAR